MDRELIQKREIQCTQEQPPACNAGCPVHVDVRGMMDCLRRGDFTAAFESYRRTIPFPSILSHICEHPCEAACKRAEAGDPVAINALERAAVSHGYRPLSVRPRKASKRKRIAVIGAGLSGLTVAYDLALKGHDVVIFEAANKPLQRLRSHVPAESIERDLSVLGTLGIEMRCSTVVDGQTVTTEFDAVYLGVGLQPLAALPPLERGPDGAIVIAAQTGATSDPKVFAGGCLRYGAPFSAITSIQDGRTASISIDRFLQGASLVANREPMGTVPTRLHTDTSGYAPLPAIVPADQDAGFTRDEAQQEATRCFPCQCLECVKVCEYLAHYGSYPKRYVREIFNNDSIIMGPRKANRMANTCSLCGLCQDVCPEGLGMAETCMEARQSMVAKGKMPQSLHDFALRDMAFSASDAFALARHQPGSNTSAYVFFPGCQLSASSPGHVVSTYAHLRGTLAGGVGLILGCCGAPAYWAGREQLYEETHATLVAQWEGLGRPQIITACSSCHQMLMRRLPQDAVTSLWPVLDAHPLPARTAIPAPGALALHDPCTARDVPEVQRSVRNLAGKLGVEIKELNAPGLSPCCGFGGLMSFANPDVANKVADRRIGEDEHDYLAYCAMCRDNFARRGKRSVHLLDLVFATGDDPASRADPGYSGRREGRAKLKRRLLKDIWGEGIMDPEPQIPLFLAPEVQSKAERRLILLDDIRQVITHAESSCEFVLHEESGHKFASRQLACVTYWVEYSEENGGYAVHTAYSHRMQLGTEVTS